MYAFRNTPLALTGKLPFLASAPGHLTFVLGIAQENNRDVSAIAIIQSIRVLFLTLCVPPLLTYLFGASKGTVLPVDILTLPSIILTLIAAVPVASLYDRLKISSTLASGRYGDKRPWSWTRDLSGATSGLS